MSGEYVLVSLCSGPTDCSFVVQDSLHCEVREFLIEGHGWKCLDAALPLRNARNASEVIAEEGTNLYELLHLIYLRGEDYEVVR